MKLKERLRLKAELELNGVVADAGSALDGLHPAIMGEEIAALAFNKRTTTLRKSVIARMVARAEDELSEQVGEENVVVLIDDGESADG